MKYILAIIFLISSYVSIGQTYNPAQGTVSNKPYAPGQAVPTDSRSYFYDATNFLWRPYQSTTEVLSYLNLSKYRTGHFSIYVNPTGTLNGNGTFTGGTIAEYWFKNGTANGNLVLKQDSTKANQSALVDTASALRTLANTKQGALSLTTTGTSGASTLIGNTLNIPQYSGGGGAVSITANTATGARVTPSPITGAGVISNDTFTVNTRARLQKVIDSLDYYQDTLFVSNTFTSGVPLTFTNVDYDSIFVKRLVAGTDISLVQNADSSVTINASLPVGSGEINTASNLGASGASWYKQKVGVDLQFRKVIAGSNISISENTNDITINASTGGEVNTASNVGVGEGVYKQKSGVNLEYKSLIGNTGVSITNNTNDLTFKVDTSTISTIAQMQKRLGDTSLVLRSLVTGEANTASNLGATGASVFESKSGVDLRFRKLIAGTNMTLTENANDITFSAALVGETNTASNVGSGSGWWKQKTGVDLEFKSVIANTGITATANTNDVTLKADTSTLSTIAQTQKRLNDSMSVIRTFIGSNVYEAKDTLAAQSSAFFCYVKSTSGTFERSNNVLKIGSVTNDDKRTITINAVMYIDSDDWGTGGGGGNGWVIIATLPTGFRPTGMLSFPISQSVPLTANTGTTPHRAADGTTGITSSVNGTNTGAAMGYIDADGNVAVKIVSVTDYGVLSGNNVLVIPIVVTYFINVND